MVEAALGFVLANPAISTACSGMNTVAMVEQNAEIARRFDAASAIDFGAVTARIDELRERLEGGVCTSCGYCQPCPQGVRIPRYMGEYLNWKGFGLRAWACQALSSVPAEQSLDNCTECGQCEEKCPQHLPIGARLKELQGLLRA
jgi:predicted aldo/keto reductase-like oxidoreductase